MELLSEGALVMQVDVAEVYESMSSGEKQHMANKLYKDDRVVAQCMKEHLEDTFALGDRVEVQHENSWIEHSEYIIAKGDRNTDTCVLINIVTGGRWSQPHLILGSDDEIRMDTFTTRHGTTGVRKVS
jgi:hypothetical protein